MLSSSDNKSVEFKSFFQLITSNAERNALKHLHGRRHNEVVEKFATSLFLYASSMDYNLVHQNMPDALATMSLHCAGKLSIHAEYYSLSEGQFRFDEQLAI